MFLLTFSNKLYKGIVYYKKIIIKITCDFFIKNSLYLFY